MPFEAPYLLGSAQKRADALNSAFRHHAGTDVLRAALNDARVGSVALVSSFGAESVVLLHMVARINPETPVLLIDTQLLFPETLEYQRELAQKFNLSDIRHISSDAIEATDPNGTLRLRDADACCHLRKVEPLETALASFDAWITGRKRFQTTERSEIEHFEAETETRLKINPLAHWRREDVQDYIINNNLPRHPLVEKGYRSIGCMPCTQPVSDGEDDRAGRWAGDEKSECGIHFVDGKIVRGGAV